MDEAQIWQLYENMRHFDKETLEQIGPYPGLMAQISGSYGDEGGLCRYLRNVRDFVAQHGGDVEAARRDIQSYSVLETMQELLLKQPPRVPFYDVRDFDFWLKIWQRRHFSRALVPVSHYRPGWPLISDVEYFFEQHRFIASIDPSTHEKMAADIVSRKTHIVRFNEDGTIEHL